MLIVLNRPGETSGSVKVGEFPEFSSKRRRYFHDTELSIDHYISPLN
jgi:hypothetical protein